MKTLFLILFLCLPIAACHAEQATKESDNIESRPKELSDAEEKAKILEIARKNNGGKEPTDSDIRQAIKQRANELYGIVDNKQQRKPRIVPKGAKPEILIYQDHLLINGHKVKIGDELDIWKMAIEGKPSCKSAKNNSVCRWDDVGVKAFTDDSHNKKQVTEFTIYINLDKRNDWAKGLVTHRPDGTPVKPDAKSKPDNPFTGYLAIDGYGIDSKTQFWEIRDSVSPERGDLGLKCAIECSRIRANGFSIDLINGKKADTLLSIVVR